MKKSASLITAALLAASTFAIAAPAEARVRHVHGVVNTNHGTYVGQSTTYRAPGQRTRSADAVGPRGGHTSVYDNRAWGGGQYSHDRTRTYANGDTRTVDADASRVAPGEWAYERDVTGRNGNTRTQTGTVTVDRGN